MIWQSKRVTVVDILTKIIWAPSFKASRPQGLKRSSAFLRDLASYIGPIQSFSWDGVAVYYTLTGAIGTSREIGFSSFVVKIVSPNKAENWTYFKVKDAQWDALQVRLGVEMESKHNVFTRDPTFLQQLENHCNELSEHLIRCNFIPSSHGHGITRPRQKHPWRRCEARWSREQETGGKGTR